MVNDKTLHNNTSVAVLAVFMNSEQIAEGCVRNEYRQELAVFSAKAEKNLP